VKKAVEQLPKRVRGAGVGLGAFVDSPERAAWAFDLGYRLLAVVPDTLLLARAARAATEPLAALGNT
jgi:2-keto-3-deoxy-L-rhamnonate aldolase RhmA